MTDRLPLGYDPICEHGNEASLHQSRKPVHVWTHIFWPIGLTIALALFFVPYYAGRSWTGWGLLAGAVVLGIPELLCLATGNAQDTFSDWIWDTCHITGTNPMNRWNAEHYLLACAYVFIVTNATVYLTNIDWRAGMASALFSSFLLFHFWGRWWT